MHHGHENPTIGADAAHDNLPSQRTMIETALKEPGLSLTILRPGWFIENALRAMACARENGVIHSFPQPVFWPP